MAVGKPLHLRLFLEGQEVPVISAQVQASMWAPASAAIQVVPLDSALDFKARTMVHLFFLEEPKVTDTNQRLSIAEGPQGPLADNAYKLLFCGEIIGFSFVKTPMTRAVVLQCLDHSSYWDQLQATMMDYGPQGNAFVSKASLYASNEALFSSAPTQGQAEKLRYWILGKPKTPGLEHVAGLAGGILHMMEVMAGLRGWRLGVNDFYSLAELRCHLLGQITAEDGDSTAQNLLDVQVFFDWIYNNFQNQPGQVSFRDMMKLLSSYIYYQIVPNPVAKFDPADTSPKTVKIDAKTVRLSTNKYYVDCLEVTIEASRILDSSNTGRTKSDVSQLGNKVEDLKKKLKSMKGIDQKLVELAEILGRHISAAVSGWDTSSRNTHLSAGFSVADKLYQNLQNAKDSKTQQPATTAQVMNLARLRTQIFRPDCFMAAPPTCNVIFPDMYSQATYDRNFIQEVTRVEISYHSRIIKPDALTAQHFVEPNIRNSAVEISKNLRNKWRILMDHERHTGIIAKEEWLPDIFNIRRPKGDTADKLRQAEVSWTHRTGLHHFFKYRIGPRTLNVAGRFSPYLVCGFPALVIQKPFYLKDWVGTQDEAIDRILNSNNPAVELGAPPQFLGMVEGLSHSVGQDGGTTQLSLSHCRNHLGIDDEFVGVVLDKLRSEQSFADLIFYTLTYEEAKTDSKKLAFLRDCTPQDTERLGSEPIADRFLNSNEAVYYKKIIKNGKEVFDLVNFSVVSSSEKQTKAASPPLTATGINPNDAAGRTIKVPAPAGTRTVGAQGFQGGTIKLIEVMAPYTVRREGKYQYYSSITVYESKIRKFKSGVPIPVEYVVQPGWLSTSYDNENIGPKVYKQFFGCDSIVDMISLSDIGSIPERINEKGMYTTVNEDQKALDARLQNIHSKRNFYSIEKAVNLIAYLYGRAKSERLDVSEYVSTFTWRPVASKADLLGTYDLELQVTGSSVKPTKGAIGFHTLSVNPVVVKAGKLIGLLDDPTVKMARMNTKQMEAVKASYDVRAEKLARVEAYVDELKKGARGFVG